MNQLVQFSILHYFFLTELLRVWIIHYEACTCVYMYMYMSVYVYLFLYTLYIYIHACMYLWVYAYVVMYVYIILLFEYPGTWRKIHVYRTSDLCVALYWDLNRILSNSLPRANERLKAISECSKAQLSERKYKLTSLIFF